jgi:hypothetical protein
MTSKPGSTLGGSSTYSGRRLLVLSAAVLACIVPSAFAQVSMTLTSPGAGNVMDNVYTSPYTATVGGQTGVPIICDDFADDSYINESWTATVSTVASLASNVKWGTSDQKGYDEAAWLAEQLLASNNPTTMGYMSYAIWYALDPTDVITYLTTTDPDSTTLSEAKFYAGQAAAQSFYAGEFSNVLVYTPDLNDPITCSGVGCPTAPPQEFLRVVTPEAPTPIIFAVDLLGLISLLAILRKRKVFGLA